MSSLTLMPTTGSIEPNAAIRGQSPDQKYRRAAITTSHRLRPLLRYFDPDVAARSEILRGLRMQPKRVSSKYLYDGRGSELFEQICELPEYYVARCDFELLRRHATDLAALLGQGITLIEPGAGSACKVQLLMAFPGLVAAYVPIDVSRPALVKTRLKLRNAYPDIDHWAICADFTRRMDTLPMPGRGRRVIFFPGSTLGNFTPAEAASLLTTFGDTVGSGGVVIVGMDHYKSGSIIRPAYDDAAGVTAAFNRNLLEHLNRDFGTDFRPDHFRHEARWDDARHLVEMRLASRCRQRVHVGPHAVDFDKGEPLITEHSCKPTPEEFRDTVTAAGLEIEACWLDEPFMYGLYCLRAP